MTGAEHEVTVQRILRKLEEFGQNKRATGFDRFVNIIAPILSGVILYLVTQLQSGIEENRTTIRPIAANTASLLAKEADTRADLQMLRRNLSALNRRDAEENTSAREARAALRERIRKLEGGAPFLQSYPGPHPPTGSVRHGGAP